jgi:beta-lactamase regulating signal transducer with metallopeptidase domain
MVDADLGLRAASGLVSFLLKTTVESLVCLVVARVAGSARWRFNVWLAMLLAFAAHWGWIWLQITRAAWTSASAAPSSPALGHGETVRRISLAQPIAGVLGTIMAVLALVYAVVLAWRGFGLVAARVRVTRAMRHARVPSERLAQEFAYVLGEAQAGGVELNHCELRVLPGIASPATVGWRRPVVIVPPVCEMQDDQELAAIFRHELKHVQRNDAFWNAVVQLCSAVLWFHPAVRQAAAQLRVQRELACDAEVVREHPQTRDVYAMCLLQFARAAGPDRMGGGTIEMASAPALLTRRVRSILTERQKMGGRSRAFRVAANVSLIAMTIAAMPHFSVMFAGDTGRFLLQTRTASLEAYDEPAPEQRRARVESHPRLRLTAVPEAAPAGAAELPLIAHDDALAAEHRAALGVLTESSGIEPAGSTEFRAEVAKSDVPRDGQHIRTTSWGSVAVDAAARMGPLMGDHDGHHGR